VSVANVEELPEDPFALDPRRGTIVCAFGKKEAGKSVFARRLWRAWPYDAVGIDVNGDIDAGEHAEKLHDLPARFPVDRPIAGERKYRKLIYRADPGSATEEHDIDRAIGLALHPSDNPTLLWLDEVGEVSRPNRTKGNLRRLLMQSRHYGPVSALLCGPRPANIDKLCYLQADGIAEYELPDPEDREKMARLMGFDSLREHDEVWRDNRARNGPYSFLYLHAPSGVVLACPPLPHP
jgi:hypothetical protein